MFSTTNDQAFGKDVFAVFGIYTAFRLLVYGILIVSIIRSTRCCRTALPFTFAHLDPRVQVVRTSRPVVCSYSYVVVPPDSVRLVCCPAAF